MVKILSRQETTIDYPGKMGQILFVSGCSFGCGFCHNPEVLSSKKEIDVEKLLLDLKSKARAGWYQGVCISGGEPTIYSDLPEFIGRLKKLGLSVKLDTNGSHPEILEQIIAGNLVDYFAMDVKGSREVYGLVTGGKANVESIDRSIGLIAGSGKEYEFRTTVPPIYQGEEARWMSVEEIGDVSKWISERAGKDSKYFLQKFLTRDATVDERFSKSKLDRKYHETPDDLLLAMKKEAEKYLSNVRIR